MEDLIVVTPTGEPISGYRPSRQLQAHRIVSRILTGSCDMRPRYVGVREVEQRVVGSLLAEWQLVILLKFAWLRLLRRRHVPIVKGDVAPTSRSGPFRDTEYLCNGMVPTQLPASLHLNRVNGTQGALACFANQVTKFRQQNWEARFRGGGLGFSFAA